MQVSPKEYLYSMALETKSTSRFLDIIIVTIDSDMSRKCTLLKIDKARVSIKARIIFTSSKAAQYLRILYKQMKPFKSLKLNVIKLRGFKWQLCLYTSSNNNFPRTPAFGSRSPSSETVWRDENKPGSGRASHNAPQHRWDLVNKNLWQQISGCFVKTEKYLSASWYLGSRCTRVDSSQNVNNPIELGMFLHRILLLETLFEEVYCGQLFEHPRKH